LLQPPSSLPCGRQRSGFAAPELAGREDGGCHVPRQSDSARARCRVTKKKEGPPEMGAPVAWVWILPDCGYWMSRLVDTSRLLCYSYAWFGQAWGIPVFHEREVLHAHRQDASSRNCRARDLRLGSPRSSLVIQCSVHLLRGLAVSPAVSFRPTSVTHGHVLDLRRRLRGSSGDNIGIQDLGQPGDRHTGWFTYDFSPHPPLEPQWHVDTFPPRFKARRTVRGWTPSSPAMSSW
jgi:hypothetical protein